MSNLPHISRPNCSCPCAAEIERLGGLLEVLAQAMVNDRARATASEATASYTDPKAARITAARTRMAELGWDGLLKGGG